MDDLIQISKINDFIFCPYSLYVHAIYEGFSQDVYHDVPQRVGKIKHENIEEGKYSNLKRYLQGLAVYSEKYGLVGKIDIYDSEERVLIERKYKIKKIYDGQKYQLWAQYFAMQEVGHEIDKLFIHSLSDNKKYQIELPGEEGEKIFADLINSMRNFEIMKEKVVVNPEKCKKCIYQELCGEAKC